MIEPPKTEKKAKTPDAEAKPVTDDKSAETVPETDAQPEAKVEPKSDAQ